MTVSKDLGVGSYQNVSVACTDANVGHGIPQLPEELPLENNCTQWLIGDGPDKENIEPKMYIYSLGMAYMLCMGVCGIVLVALGSSLSDFAENCGKTSTEVGSVFVSRGVGAVVGAIFSAKLFSWTYGNTVISAVLVALTSCLLGIPFVRSIYLLHMSFFCMGLCTAVTDTGCQIMTRKLHGAAAGPWLGANTVVFGISGALVPLVAFYTDSLFIQYSILSSVTVAVAVFTILLPPPEESGCMKGVPSRGKGHEVAARHVSAKKKKSVFGSMGRFCGRHHIEFLISGMVCCLVGGKVGATAYLTQYVEDTDAIADGYSSLLIVVLWVAITVGRLAGLQDQLHITLPKLYRHTTLLFAGGAAAMVPILLFQSSAVVLWVGVAMFGLFNGPTVGYCYDLNNRITPPSEEGMAVVMFGLNLGASFVPYLISGVWLVTGWPQTLMAVVLASHVIPYPLMLSSKRLHEADWRREREAIMAASAAAGSGTDESGETGSSKTTPQSASSSPSFSV